MPLVKLLENMDLENSQKEILKQVIVKPCLTTASFKLLTDEQLCAIGFPLPAIVEMKALLESSSEVLTPVSLSTPSKTTSSSSTPSANFTTVRGENVDDELNVEKLKELAGHISVKAANGLKVLTRLVVDEMAKVSAVFSKTFLSDRLKFSNCFCIKRVPGTAMDKLKPSTSTKIQYAKLAVDAFCFFVHLVLCFHCWDI